MTPDERRNKAEGLMERTGYGKTPSKERREPDYVPRHADGGATKAKGKKGTTVNVIIDSRPRPPMALPPRAALPPGVAPTRPAIPPQVAQAIQAGAGAAPPAPGMAPPGIAPKPPGAMKRGGKVC